MTVFLQEEAEDLSKDSKLEGFVYQPLSTVRRTPIRSHPLLVKKRKNPIYFLELAVPVYATKIPSKKLSSIFLLTLYSITFHHLSAIDNPGNASKHLADRNYKQDSPDP
ncbi:hypothetical protein JTE90_029064 [Oedothorax gibbosus]|uniref:Uncharacterized protein n=1 Tax=Oedothorax gibbosus TaxID=931172 RepID=A0AAV6UWR8_9ARAC|nr:hypothetical protein JTE90_029064 [Oedothorax gibbosus]